MNKLELDFYDWKPSISRDEVQLFALAEILIEKGIITEDDYNKKLDEINERVCSSELRYNLKYL